jgi:NDP-sugar pyrophosphorylase family protein
VKAMVLAAGYGTRLGHLTEQRPKGMLDVGGRPMLEYIIRHLASHGFNEIGLNLHFMPESIRGFFGNGSALGVSITYSWEPELLGTAGGVLQMREFLDDGRPFLVHYGDVVTDQDFTALLRAHREKRAVATLLVHQRPGSNSVVVMDDERRITTFLERPSTDQRRGIDSPWVNSGVCVCEPELFDFLPAEQPSDLPAHVFQRLAARGRLYGYPLDAYRCAVDSEERLMELRAAVSDNQVWHSSPGSPPG